jgi:hypothetical protein
MNGRVYDPVLARFLSPDPDIRSPGDLQNYNRYSYVLNNPLRYTDPTGYDPWSDLGNWFYDNAISIAEAVTTVVACAAAPGVGCYAAGAMWAYFNSAVALVQGASFDQTALTITISIEGGALSGVTGALLGPTANPIWGLVAGSASAAATTAMSDVASGRNLGWDVLESAAMSAAEGAATLGLKKAIELSQASAQVQGGWSSGEAAVERIANETVTDGGQAAQEAAPISWQATKPPPGAIPCFSRDLRRCIDEALDAAWFLGNPGGRLYGSGQSNPRWITETAGEVYDTGNGYSYALHPSPYADASRFGWTDANGGSVVALIHTHPNGIPFLPDEFSKADYNALVGLGRLQQATGFLNPLLPLVSVIRISATTGDDIVWAYGVAVPFSGRPPGALGR